MTPLVVLEGDAHARGLGQARACPDAAPAVRAAIRDRLAAAPTGTPGARAFLAAQHEATARLAPEALAELAGITEGFGLDPDEGFVFLHLGCLADLAGLPDDRDGCTAFARAGRVAKNRDFRPEHAALQRAFAHRDPAWGGRSVFCLGSLGAPGAWSSGMNSDGFALADTQIPTAEHGPGILRYFLMNRLLAGCATVAEALELIRALPHAGGGSLVLADASGAAAAVELRHGRVEIEQGACVARTNHSTGAPDRLAPVSHSEARLATLRAALADTADARAILALHAPEALCRHEPDPSPTLAGAVYDTPRRSAAIAFGPPCTARWRVFALGAEGWRETHA
ncbi:C45 family autoproteolytic acyltransferase/hydolase [Elioraea sp.]|uniref:C45 family autoproteolytic acyltransferase/hydolase n=1 Tax=Elioraea sp. TaxID=2185103 RepID=UPI003F73061A